MAIWLYAAPQNAENLRQVSKIYVDSLGNKQGADELRRQIIAKLRKLHDVTVVGTKEEADAVLSGTSELWIKGYFSLNPRAHSLESGAQPVYSGFLSVELKGKANETLWSYLVTPDRHHTVDVSQDLAGHMAKKLLEALAAEKTK
jgi:hypothetical protein